MTLDFHVYAGKWVRSALEKYSKNILAMPKMHPDIIDPTIWFPDPY
jgi:hypothetical protein